MEPQSAESVVVAPPETMAAMIDSAENGPNGDAALLDEDHRLNKIMESENGYVSPNNKPVVELNCYVCMKVFASQSNLKRHLEIHADFKGFVCGICNKDFCQSRYLDKHMMTHEGEEMYKCGACSMTFTILAQYRSHMKTHVRGKSGSHCDLCFKSYTDANALARHVRLIHNRPPEEMHKCWLCDESFELYSIFRAHIRSHRGEKPHHCEQCGKGFADATLLKRHRRIHLTEKPFICGLCDKGFCLPRYVYVHMKVHTGEKPHVCHTCGKAFLESSSLTKHIRTHTGEKLYKCTFCDKRFTQTGHLHSHTKTHTGEKSAFCIICNQPFFNSSALNRHNRKIHSGEKRYKCTTCDCAFAKYTLLKLHQRIHSGVHHIHCVTCDRHFADTVALRRHKNTMVHKKGISEGDLTSDKVSTSLSYTILSSGLNSMCDTTLQEDASSHSNVETPSESIDAAFYEDTLPHADGASHGDSVAKVDTLPQNSSAIASFMAHVGMVSKHVMSHDKTLTNPNGETVQDADSTPDEDHTGRLLDDDNLCDFKTNNIDQEPMIEFVKDEVMISHTDEKDIL